MLVQDPSKKKQRIYVMLLDGGTHQHFETIFFACLSVENAVFFIAVCF
jgi:hypothetical protein